MSYRTVFLLFFGQSLLVLAFLGLTDRWRQVEMPDTASYRDFPWSSGKDAFQSVRTPGYPIFLRTIQTIDVDLSSITAWQFATVLASTIFLAWSLLQCGWRPILTLAAVSPILWSALVLQQSHVVLPDVLAQSLAVSVIASMMLSIHREQPWPWIIMTSLLLSATILTKPSYLFLLVLVPAFVAVLRYASFGSPIAAWRMGMLSAGASWLPFLGYCCFRWIVVGHFGLVSFGGYNIVGIGAQLLTRDDLPRLTGQSHVYAEQILDERQQRYGAIDSVEYSKFPGRYDEVVWQISVPIARKLCSDDSIAMNNLMSKFSWQTIAIGPERYLRWLWTGAKLAYREALDLTTKNPAVIAAFLWLGWRILASTKLNNQSQELDDSKFESSPSRSSLYSYEVRCWFIVGLGFCFGKLGLVILVEPPIVRYCAPAALFFTSFVCVLVAALNTTDTAVNNELPPS